MDRREQIESIIVGTLLNSIHTTEFYDECKNLITPEMFHNGKLGEIYLIISDMFANGKDSTTPLDICEEYDWSLSDDLVRKMVDLATDFYFVSKKTAYNENIRLSNRFHKNYTYVTFADYVAKLYSMA